MNDRDDEGPPDPERVGHRVYGLIADGQYSRAIELAQILAEWWLFQIRGCPGDAERTHAVIQSATFNGMAHAMRGVIMFQERTRELRKSRFSN